MWYYRNVGGERCPIVDTFWQTETGGHMMTPLPGATPLVPGSCTLPLPGLARPMWVVQAGTAVSSRTRPQAPNSVNLLRWGAAAVAASAATGRCVVERWDYAAGTQAFACAVTTTVEPARA